MATTLTSLPIKSNEIEAIDCKFVRYSPPPNGNTSYDDLHLIKEAVKLKNGEVKRRVRLVYNYERPYWIVLPTERNFYQKKDYIAVDRCTKFTARECDLIKEIPRRLDQGYRSFFSLRQVYNSPYIFGTTVSSRTELKHSYQHKYNNFFIANEVFYIDTETNMTDKKKANEIIILSFAVGKKICCGFLKSFVEGRVNVIETIIELGKEHLPEYFRNDQWEIEWKIADTPMELVEWMIGYAHQYKPDTMTAWNLPFDLDRITETVTKAGVAMKDIICDPIVPEAYRHYDVIKDSPIRKKEDGKGIKKKYYELWHDVDTMASWEFVDMMAAYHFALEPTLTVPMNLNAVLERNGLPQKLKFDFTKSINGRDWHKNMQSDYPIHYILYNIADVMRMRELDQKTQLLNVTLPLYVDNSDLRTYKSQPSLLADKIHYLCLELGYVYGCPSSNMKDKWDDILGERRGLIATLSPHLLTHLNAISCLEGLDVMSTIYMFVSDIDLEGSYPSSTRGYGVSRTTTVNELLSMEGLTLQQARSIGMLLNSPVNAMEILRHGYRAPSLQELDKLYDQYIHEQRAPAFQGQDTLGDHRAH